MIVKHQPISDKKNNIIFASEFLFRNDPQLLHDSLQYVIDLTELDWEIWGDPGNPESQEFPDPWIASSLIDVWMRFKENPGGSSRPLRD